MDKGLEYHKETINGYPFRLRYLPGGLFEMGSNETKLAFGKESPIHKVELSPFYIGEYLVTQALWKTVMGADHNPSRFVGDDRPVEQVSWIDIVEGNQEQSAFMQRLNQQTNERRPGGFMYRLPTEAEWEYAARGGDTYEYAGSDLLKAVGWYWGNSHRETKAVGLKQPNSYGLYDMSGNVREWCMDKYSDSFYQACQDQGIIKDPICKDENAQNRVFRGGSWSFSPQNCRVSSRDDWHPALRNDFVGFRLVLAPVQR